MLAEIAQRCGTDKFEHEYCDHYETHLPDRVTHINLLEIGVAKGDSMRMWAEYYPQGNLVGIDNNPDILNIPQEGFRLIHGDGTKWSNDLLGAMKLDVVVDDGSHNASDIFKSFTALWPTIVPGGWYIIEDLTTQFDAFWGGSETGSKVTETIYDMLIQTIKHQELSELHAYGQIVFMRKM